MKNHGDCIYTNRLFLSFSETMLRIRLHIALLTSFFTFTFVLMFFALMQNYAHAWVLSSISAHDAIGGHVTGIQSELLPTFWGLHAAPIFDFDSDDSLQKYLNADHPFADASYVPTDLTSIDSNFTANNPKAFQLRQEALIYFDDMARHFRNAFSWDRLYIVSAYRSKWFQDYLIKQWCSLLKCAAIGTSEHQAGLALDLSVVSRWGKSYSLDSAYPNKYSDWLKANAATFGFHNTYQKWVDVDGKIVEWRHRRYLGLTLAKILAENNQTFAEYYTSTNN